MCMNGTFTPYDLVRMRLELRKWALASAPPRTGHKLTGKAGFRSRDAPPGVRTAIHGANKQDRLDSAVS